MHVLNIYISTIYKNSSDCYNFLTINVESVSLKVVHFTGHQQSSTGNVTTFLMRNLTRLLFYINDDSKTRMKYSICKSCILIAHFVAFLSI